MARLYLFAEGKTELTFADLVLTSHLANHGVYLKHRIEVAHARKNHTTHRGGGRKFGPVKRDIERFLKQERGGDVFFTTMIDLYAIYSDFPGLNEAEKFRHDPRKRVELLEQSFASEVGDPRFIPYLQLHEFEALLFVDPSHFAKRYEKADRKIQELREIADKKESPELINDGQTTAPSKRIIDAFPTYKKDKSQIGPLVAKDIGLAAIRAKCPHFNAWLTRLESLGGPGAAT
jgi:hypothetical protein